MPLLAEPQLPFHPLMAPDRPPLQPSFTFFQEGGGMVAAIPSGGSMDVRFEKCTIASNYAVCMEPPLLSLGKADETHVRSG